MSSNSSPLSTGSPLLPADGPCPVTMALRAEDGWFLSHGWTLAMQEYDMTIMYRKG